MLWKFLNIHASNSNQVTTGKIGIDLERILKINQEADPSVWKTEVDPK